MLYDLAIIGGGPAGVAAGVYAARKKLKTVFIAESFGGQSVVSTGIENWIGTINIPGELLAKNLRDHLFAYASDVVKIVEGSLVKKIEKNGENFDVKTDSESFLARTVLVATGSSRKRLDITNADKFEHKGITYCASCDGPLFGGKDVAVIGGGNAAFETAAQLSAYCKNVYIIVRSDNFRADPVTVEKVLAHANVHVIKNAALQSVEGSSFVSGLIYNDANSNKMETLPVEGIFVEIGSVPATSFVSNFVKMDQWKHIIVDPKNQKTSVEGIWAAGDCTDGLYHQNNIAAGDAVKALEDIYLYLHA